MSFFTICGIYIRNKIISIKSCRLLKILISNNQINDVAAGHVRPLLILQCIPQPLRPSEGAQDDREFQLRVAGPNR
jgi:hypothetical protein